MQLFDDDACSGNAVGDAFDVFESRCGRRRRRRTNFGGKIGDGETLIGDLYGSSLSLIDGNGNALACCEITEKPSTLR